MNGRKQSLLMSCICSLMLLGACDSSTPTEPSPTVPSDNQNSTGNNSDSGNEYDGDYTGYVSDAMSENAADHEHADDYTWDSSKVTAITLSGNNITAGDTNVVVDGSSATIVSAGTYSISGSLDNGRIIVDTEDDGIVQLILNGASIACTNSAPLYIKNAEKTVILLTEGTDNSIKDGSSYVFEDAEDDEPNAALFSKDDLTICGPGRLSVTGNHNDGIASKDGLIITNATITVEAVDDGIRGKNYLIIRDSSITLNSQGDGLKSDNDEDSACGYIFLESVEMTITAEGDGMAAETDVIIIDGEYLITSGGGSNARIDESTSTKGIKGVVNIIIDNGRFTIDSSDDAIHSNGSLTINSGYFTLSTGDDAIHADSILTINGGEIDITQSFEGIESEEITINDGTFHIVSSDDGINIAGGRDGSGADGGWPGPGGGGGRIMAVDYYLYINGGSIAIEAIGDGIDSNGSIEMTGGSVIIHGPTADMNSALDYDASFTLTGGFIIAAGSAGMAQAPDRSSTQYSMLINFRSTIQAGTLFHIQASDGTGICSFVPLKRYQSIAFSSPELASGTTYSVYTGGSITGSDFNGVYSGGTYTPGTNYTSFTISDIVTRLSR